MDSASNRFVVRGHINQRELLVMLIGIGALWHKTNDDMYISKAKLLTRQIVIWYF